MQADEARAQFAVRFYRWALEQWEVELAAGFPVLGLLNTAASDLCTAVLRTLPEESRRGVAVALTKRAHREGVAAAGEKVSAEDEARLTDFDTRRRLARSSVKGGRGAPGDVRRALRPSLRDRLEPLGECRSLGSLEWLFARRQEYWVTETVVDFGGSKGDLTYWHRVTSDSVRLTDGMVSILGWLGVSNTSWIVRDENDLAIATEQLLFSAGVFTEALRDLTKGLR